MRVHPELLEAQQVSAAANGGDVWQRRFREINEFERDLVDHGVRIVKLLLNISNEEQRVRFLRRCDLPEKHWKFSASDINEREHWMSTSTPSEMLAHTTRIGRRGTSFRPTISGSRAGGGLYYRPPSCGSTPDPGGRRRAA